MEPYPLVFEPILKEKVWGGRNLADLGKPLPSSTMVGESWELADLPESIEGGRSVIANGPLAGRTLQAAIDAWRPQIMGGAELSAEGGFPLLLKFLDARENLSVQVHPDQAYVDRHPEAHLKSEAWFVVKADRGSVIYKGVKPHVTAEDFARHITTGEVVEDLIAVEVAPGDCHYLPSGTCHALGAGILVAEIQTPSDTTFRVYDWGRTDRQLHVEEALECITFGAAPQAAEAPGVPVEVEGLRTTPRSKTEYFAIEQVEAVADAFYRVETSGMPEVWMMLRGRGRIEAATSPPVGLAAGTTVLVPAALAGAEAALDPAAMLLRITLRSPLEGLIA
ncbi:MAG: type I phosphomannose isomerase catalytic subunit [Planctomycetota bacterium]|jgi:mannose-6-phosphate isomerase